MGQHHFHHWPTEAGATIQSVQSEVDLLMPQMRATHKEWYSDYATLAFPA